jgi:methyltransferase (TIGR00027 family)
MAMDGGRPSQTAVLVCQGRAVAHGRLAVGRFDDPSAMTMLLEPERHAVEEVRNGIAPPDWRDSIEFERLRATAEVMVPRTIAVDEAVRATPNPPLVILGAGLDGRAWRMPELRGVDVFEVDQPASQAENKARVAGQRPLVRSLLFVAVDFAHDDLADALASESHSPSVPTTWLWEGVVPYLSPADVDDTLRVLDGRSAPGSRLVVNYQSRTLPAAVGRRVAGLLARAARRADPLTHEPQRSSWKPAAIAAMAKSHGFVVQRDEDLMTIAAGLDIPVKNPRSVGVERIAVAKR